MSLVVLVIAGLLTHFPGPTPAINVVGVVLLAMLWVILLGIRGAYEVGYLGSGIEGYRRVVESGLLVVLVLCAGSFIFKLPTARSFVLLVFVFGVTVTVFSRWVFRTWLFAQRQKQRLRHRVWVISPDDELHHMVATIANDPNREFRVVGVGWAPMLASRFDAWLDFQFEQLAAVDAEFVALSPNAANYPELMSALTPEVLTWVLVGS